MRHDQTALGAHSENGRKIAEFVCSMRHGDTPEDVLDIAKKCLVDWCGVALGAYRQQAGIAVRRAVESWRSRGTAQVLLGPTTSPPAASLINGTLAHCLDFDDTHIDSVAHLSGPTWAAVLALGGAQGASEVQMLRAFVSGYEVGAKLGGSGFGVAVDQHGWHSPGIFGCLAAAAGSCSLLGLEEAAIPHALVAAATQAAGLTASFGTMSKPFHAGKAAFNGLIAAQLASVGFIAGTEILEPAGGLARTLVQNSEIAMDHVDFGGNWALARNSFKPYACCLLTHAAVDAAKSMHGEFSNDQICRIEAHVNPMAIHLAGKTAVTTSLEGKFSLSFCIALAVHGYKLTESDFAPSSLEDEEIQRTSAKVVLIPDEGLHKTQDEIHFQLADGTVIVGRADNALGTPDNPITWEDIREKFFSLVEPVLGDRTSGLFSTLRDFERPGQYQAFTDFVSQNISDKLS